MSDIYSATRTSQSVATITSFLDQISGPGIQGYAAKYLKSELTRKAKFLPDGVPVDKNALSIGAFDGFLATEARLATHQIPTPGPSDFNSPLAAITLMAQRKIRGILGEWDFDLVTADCSFSGGSSTRLPRRKSVPANKFVGTPHVTPGCLPVMERYLEKNPLWEQILISHQQSSAVFCIVPGSEFFTVDKSASSRRPACKEPEINMFFQKGLGAYIRRKLRNIRFDPDARHPGWRNGINLNTQEVNAELAFEASYSGRLATIDLSAASDSVSLQLIDLLLPRDYADYINLIRSPLMKGLDKEWYMLHKVSTMGNGFTFELESLIFWAITSSVVDWMKVSDRRVAVFGDDIIVSSEAAPMVCEYLELFGFLPNLKKTHLDGPFRESCGKHYYHGYDVTPFNITNPISNASELCHLVNRLRSWGVRTRIDVGGLVDKLLLLYGETLPLVPSWMGTKAGICCDSLSELMSYGRVRLAHQKNGIYLQNVQFQAYVPRTEPNDSVSEDGEYLDWLLKSSPYSSSDPEHTGAISDSILKPFAEWQEDPDIIRPDETRHRRVLSMRKRWKAVRWWKEGLYFGQVPSVYVMA